MSRVTPLRYDRMTFVSGQIRPMYGYRSYMTADGQFKVCYMNGGWMVRRFCASASVWDGVVASGLADIALPRRRDIVEALAVVLETIE